MKMTLEINDVAEARAILAAISGQAPVAPPATAAPIQTPSAPAVSVPTPVAPPAPAVSVPAPVAPPAPAAVPTAAPTYNIDQIAAAGANLMDAGKQMELIALLGQFGVQAITQLKPEQLGAFATALRGMGANL